MNLSAKIVSILAICAVVTASSAFAKSGKIHQRVKTADCTFSYEYGRTGSGCKGGITLRTNAKLAALIEHRRGDCRFNYESGRYLGSQCPPDSSGYFILARSGGNAPNDNRN
jgi:hypothetical protein